MSTRASIRVFEGTSDDAQVILEAYQHSDGYPSWTGRKLAKFLTSETLGNGAAKGVFNGAGDLAAKLVCAFKVDDDGVIDGGFYIEKAFPQEWSYDVYAPRPSFGDDLGEAIIVKVSSEYGGADWVGTLSEFADLCDEDDADNAFGRVYVC